MVESIIALFYRSIQTFSEDKIKRSVYSKMARNYITVYRIIKTSLGFESYLNELPDLLRKYFTKFSCRNHRLPIEAGVRSQVLRDMRICQFCETDIGDEFHYLLCCPNFKEEREHFINSKYYVRPSTFYLHKLFKQTKAENCEIIICKF